MKYGLARWLINPKQGRYSVGFGDSQIKEIIIDSKYNNLYEGLCTQYVFKCADDSVFPIDKTEAFGIVYLSKEEARQWVLDNMNLVEISHYVFEISPQMEIMGNIIPQRLFTID